jgi:hypothetical protein
VGNITVQAHLSLFVQIFPIIMVLQREYKINPIQGVNQLQSTDFVLKLPAGFFRGGCTSVNPDDFKPWAQIETRAKTL